MVTDRTVHSQSQHKLNTKKKISFTGFQILIFKVNPMTVQCLAVVKFQQVFLVNTLSLMITDHVHTAHLSLSISLTLSLFS